MVSPTQQENIPDQLERELQYYLFKYSPLRLFPVLESLENVQGFIATISTFLAERIRQEAIAEARCGRPDAAFKRALRWLREIIWEDFINYFSDPLIQRTLRLATTIKRTPALPRKLKGGEYDSRLLAIKFEVLFQKLKPFFKRLPAKRRAGGSALARLIAEGMYDEKLRNWEGDLLKAANKVLSIPWWPAEAKPSFWFEEKDIIGLTAHQATYRVLAHEIEREAKGIQRLTANKGRSEEALRRIVRQGNKALPPTALEDIERVKWQHDPAVCQLFQCVHPVSEVSCQPSPQLSQSR